MFRLQTYNNQQQHQKRFQSASPKRVIKKCAFDIDSLLKPTNNSSYADDTEDGSSDDGNIQFECSSYTLITNNNLTSHSKMKFKRIRTTFTAEQLEKLEAVFEKQQYMVGNERLYLAKQLHLSETQVKIWFQNRRIKWRRQIQDIHSP